MAINRKCGLGGSDIAAILGKSKWYTPLDLYNEKTGFVQNTEKDCFTRGLVLESLIKHSFENGYNLKITNEQKELIHPEYNYFFGHIDGETEEGKALIEYKTTASLDGFGEEWSDQIPSYYLTQIHWYMALNQNYEKAYLALLHLPYNHLQDLSAIYQENPFSPDLINKLNLKPKIYLIYKNTEMQSLLIKAGLKFWNEHIIPRIPPSAKNMEDLRNLYPIAEEDKSVVADEQTLMLIDKYHEIKNEFEKLEKEDEKIKTEICKIIGNAEILLNSEGKKLVTWKNQDSERIDTKILKSKYLEIAKECSKTINTRILRIS